MRPEADVGVVKVDPSARLGREAGLTALLRVGNPVRRSAAPSENNCSLSVGVVSAKDAPRALTSSRSGDAIQTDAALNRGTQGAVLDAKGGVGMNSQSALRWRRVAWGSRSRRMVRRSVSEIRAGRFNYA